MIKFFLVLSFFISSMGFAQSTDTSEFESGAIKEAQMGAHGNTKADAAMKLVAICESQHPFVTSGLANLVGIKEMEFHISGDLAYQAGTATYARAKCIFKLK